MECAGRDWGSLTALVFVAPLLSPITVALTWSLLGWRMTVARVVAALAGSALLGALINRFEPWVGYIPFDPEAASLMFSLVSNRYERASMIVTSNKPFSKWGEIFGDDMAATAMIDRLIHHSEILSLKGDSYRLRGKDLDARIAARHPEIG